MRLKLYILLAIMVILAALFALYNTYWTSAESCKVVQTPGHKPFRILTGPQPGRYWIVDQRNGLICLTENPPGSWSADYYPIGIVYDACGPDNNGYIYCSLLGPTQGIGVFDCATSGMVDTIPLEHYPSHLVLSPDQTTLYASGWGWPEVGEGYNDAESSEHIDSGIIWKIDLSTRAVTIASTGALPESIFLAQSNQGDRLLVFCHEVSDLMDDNWFVGKANKTDIFECGTMNRVSSMETPYASPDTYENSFLKWSENPDLVALCGSSLQDIPDRPEFKDGIWLIDPDTGSVADTLTVKNANGVPVGIRQAIPNMDNPEELYVSVGQPLEWASDWILVVDKVTGQTVRSINTGGKGYLPFFIYQILDGRLIVTCGTDEKILIIDPDQS